MGNGIENTGEQVAAAGGSRLEQVYLNMPEARFYFSGDEDVQEGMLRAYIGSEDLELQSLQHFSQSGENITYYVLLDVSASISESAFADIVDGLQSFAGKLEAGDRMIFMTFGEEVQTIFERSGGELAETAGEAFAGLVNHDQKTLLFEAISQAAQMAGQVPADECTRRVALVITDGEDIARGKATKDEALATLSQTGLPVYSFTVSEAKSDAINAFGEFSRATGGDLTILEKGEAAKGLEALREGLESSYVAVFTADSNRVSRGMVSVTLEVSDGETLQTEAMQERWIADAENPTVKEVSVEGAAQLKVQFSEPVEGAQAAENYILQDEAGESHLPAFASVGSDGTSVVLTFSQDLAGGSYELSLNGITDASMEANPLEGSTSVVIEGATAGDELTQETGEPDTGGNPVIYAGIGLGVLLLLLVVILLGKKKKKQEPEGDPTSEKAVVADGGQVILPESREERIRLKVEKRHLDERQVFFHVKGQKEEIPVMIRSSLIVGRSSMCQLIFDDPTLSRQHFALELESGEIRIHNLSTSGFTTVNGKKLGTEARTLHSGDQIGAGQLVMTVRW
ncbi:MAG: FHA domain-containing protein [Clostridiales bacterium]|nr:FHA domain-containing protein [Clostridiales bacterium]